MNIYVDLDCNLDGCHAVLSSQPRSSGSFDPLDCTLLCSPVLDSTFVVHEDQVVEKVGVKQPNYSIIIYEYAWEYEEEPVVKDDLLLSAPHFLFPDIFCDSAIYTFSCENSFKYVSTSDHSKNT